MTFGRIVITMQDGTVFRGSLVRENFERGYWIALLQEDGSQLTLDLGKVHVVEPDEDAPPVVLCIED